MPEESIQKDNKDKETVKTSPPPSKQSKESTPNLLEKFLEIITGVGSDERVKLKKLKNIAKELNSLKYKFYNFRKDQVLPQFGEFFYDIYRISQNFTKFFDVKNHSNTIKEFYLIL